MSYFASRCSMFLAFATLSAGTLFAEDAKKQASITISPATTYITKPLTKEGYINYLDALNKHYKRGVTPENNAAVILVQVLGLQNFSDTALQKYCQRLQIPIPKKKTPLLVNRNNEFLPASIRLTDLMEKTWSKNEYPEVAHWVEQNREALKYITKASLYSRLYFPLMPLSSADETEDQTDQMLISLPGYSLIQIRECAHLLVLRAMQRTEEGNVNGATEDLLACHRLARLVGQGPMIIDSIVSIAIDEMAYHADHVLAHSGRASSDQLLTFQRQLNQLPAPVDVAVKVNFGDRLMFLDALMHFERLDLLLKETDQPQGENAGWFWERVEERLRIELLDWDLMLKTTNSWYDRF